MNDLWSFFLGLGDGLQNALSAANTLPVLLIGILIGLFQPKPAGYALKALIVLIIAMAVPIFWPTLSGRQPVWPDLRHLSTIVQIFMQYVVAFGIIGALGSLKSLRKAPAAKAAH